MDFTTTVEPQALVERECPPVATCVKADGSLFVDFGKAAFGSLTVPVSPASDRSSLTVHLGEKLQDGEPDCIDRDPPGTIRYRRIEQHLVPGQQRCRLLIPPDDRNTGPAAVRMPPEIGEVLPFRYAEIEQGADLDSTAIRQVRVHYPFNDQAACFQSSNDVLNAVWELCKYTIKATTFCGLYVDGDRERIPYEGDAYINQLAHYCVDQEYRMARATHEYMIQNPTWCTEWHLHSVLIAWADYMYSGETHSLETFYEDLRVKTLLDFAREDGLISVDPELRTPEIQARVAPHFARGIIRENIRDVVDWPPGSFSDGGTGERDNHEIRPINTVVNAYHCHTLRLMAGIAGALGRNGDRQWFAGRAQRVAARINELLFDRDRGLYIDGEGSQHSSLHSNLFPLAFGLVPEERRPQLLDFVKERGMACSVYAAQYLLEALYLNGEAEHALQLMTATHDRSWWNMIRSGSTMTMEAWDIKYKNNLDWNHAWGAAPGNIVGRFLLGVRPLDPGFRRILLHPQPASLRQARGTLPTPRGTVTVDINNEPDQAFQMTLQIPPETTAAILLPHDHAPAGRLRLDGADIQAQSRAEGLLLDDLPPGRHEVCAPGV